MYDIYMKAIYHYNLDFFNKDTEELYYFLGFIASDGYVNDEYVSLALNEKDKEILDKFTNIICPDKPLRYKESTKSYELKISNKKLAQKTKTFFRMKTNKKCLEIEFPYIPNSFLKDFIRGYVDGDGCIDFTLAKKGEKRYKGARLRILGNESFLYELNNATKDFYQHKTNAIRKKGKENVYEVTYNFKTAKNILKSLYENNTISLERKNLKAQDIINEEIV